MLQGLKLTITKPWKLTFLDSLLDAKALLARQCPMSFISCFYTLNVCVSPKMPMLKLNPKVMVIGGGAFTGDLVTRGEPS